MAISNGERSGSRRKSGVNSKTGADISMSPKQRGGARANAGRKPGHGKYGESTRPLRVPDSLYNDIVSYVENKGYNLPVYGMRVPMGPAAASIDYVERVMNLNELIQNPSATFFHSVTGDSMEPTVSAGDLAMIDAKVEAIHNDVVLASIDGAVTLKRLKKIRGQVWLEADNQKYEPILLDSEVENLIQGVMLFSIRPISTNHVRRF